MDAKNITPRSGFSLTELMIVVGVIGVVMLGSMRMFQDAFKTQSKVEAGQDAILVADQLAQILSDAPTCTELMKGTFSGSGTPVVMGKGLYKGAILGRIQISDLRLRDVSELTKEVFLAKVEIRGEYANGEHGGQFVRQLPVVYRTDKQSYIKECLGDNFGIIGNCKSLGGKWDASKRKCDFCPALGGESNARGRCQLAGTPIASCPIQKAFGANSTGGVCGASWDADFSGDSIRYLGSFGHIKSETVGYYKQDLQKALDASPQSESTVKLLGGKGHASWVITVDPMDVAINKPCSAMAFFTIRCP